MPRLGTIPASTPGHGSERRPVTARRQDDFRARVAVLRPINDSVGSPWVTSLSPTMPIPRGTLSRAVPIAALPIPVHIFTTFASSAMFGVHEASAADASIALLTSTWSGSAEDVYPPAADELTAARPHYTLAAIRQTDVGERASRAGWPPD